MIIKTKTLAIHSIQANMLGTEQEDNVLNVLLSNGKTLKITGKNINSVSEIDNSIHFYPSVGRENNSKDMDDYFTMEVI